MINYIMNLPEVVQAGIVLALLIAVPCVLFWISDKLPEA